MLLGAFVCLGSLLFRKGPIVLGACIGAALASLNLIVLGRLAQAVLKKGGQRKKIILFVALGAKMAVLIGIVYGVVVYLPVSKGAFAVGLSTLVFSVMIGGLRASTH